MFQTEYTIDFDRMVQINSETKVERPVRWKHGGQPACWECRVDGKWTAYNTADSAILSQLFAQAPAEKVDRMLSFSNQMYTLDFARMLQINQITKVERPIRALPLTKPTVYVTAPAPPNVKPATTLIEKAGSSAPSAAAPAKDILAIRKLIEYFLSDENLVEDADLRDKLVQAPDGWLSLEVLVNKDRMKKLKATLPDLQLAARDLKILEKKVSQIAAHPALTSPTKPTPSLFASTATLCFLALYELIFMSLCLCACLRTFASFFRPLRLKSAIGLGLA